MNGYLGGLAARADGDKGLPRPRPVGLFEPLLDLPPVAPGTAPARLAPVVPGPEPEMRPAPMRGARPKGGPAGPAGSESGGHQAIQREPVTEAGVRADIPPRSAPRLADRQEADAAGPAGLVGPVGSARTTDPIYPIDTTGADKARRGRTTWAGPVAAPGRKRGPSPAADGLAAGGLASGGLAAGEMAPGGLAPGGLAPGGLAPGGLAPGGLAASELAAGGLAAGELGAGGLAAGGLAAGGLASGGLGTGGLANGELGVGAAASGEVAPDAAATAPRPGVRRPRAPGDEPAGHLMPRDFPADVVPRDSGDGGGWGGVRSEAGPRLAPAPRLAEAPQAPAVHVTIGRIEIRAAAPSSETSRVERHRRPPMSLGEYLGGRAAGR